MQQAPEKWLTHFFEILRAPNECPGRYSSCYRLCGLGDQPFEALIASQIVPTRVEL